MSTTRVLRLLIYLALFAAILFLASCALIPRTSVPCADIASLSTASPSVSAVPGTSWLYQLQSADPDAIAASSFDIAVIDYSRDGSAAGAYTATQLESIRTRGGPTTILAYLSIGEAEDYRFYFDPAWLTPLFGRPGRDAPCWLGRTNREWPGNYKVQYWSNGWQAIVFSYLDDILAAGFDGVYLDIIDAYEYWPDERNGEGFSISQRLAADRMINFVLEICNHARASDPGFLVVPQNGEGILAYDDGNGDFASATYLDAISGIGIEDLYYNETSMQSAADIAERTSYLDQIRDAGKTVLVVDYVDDGTQSDSNAARIADFRSRALADGFIPYAARSDRELNVIN